MQYPGELPDPHALQTRVGCRRGALQNPVVQLRLRPQVLLQRGYEFGTLHQSIL
jgi:hypothetical protein